MISSDLRAVFVFLWWEYSVYGQCNVRTIKY